MGALSGDMIICLVGYPEPFYEPLTTLSWLAGRHQALSRWLTE
ncbi:hypothetical protein [Streptomyces sp. 900116325]